MRTLAALLLAMVAEPCIAPAAAQTLLQTPAQPASPTAFEAAPQTPGQAAYDPKDFKREVVRTRFARSIQASVWLGIARL